jgi:hypothetical protein
MLATPRTDDHGATEDRDINVVINNFTNPTKAQLPAIEGTVIRIPLPPSKGTPQVSKESNQFGPDNVPTITEKSSGLSPLLATIDPRQDGRVEKREPSTDNDKA